MIEELMRHVSIILSTTFIFMIVKYIVEIGNVVEKKNSKTIETELSIIDKKIKTVYISTGKSIVPVKHYELIVDFGGEKHIVSVGQNTYASIEVGNSAMFICYYNSEQELIDICLGE